MKEKGNEQDKHLLSHPNISDLAYNAFYQNIVSGAWAVGEKIPTEVELCAQYGVSRVSVRSAIQRLSAFGMLEIRRGDGTYIKEFSLQEYLAQAVPFIVRGANPSELAEFREALEAAAIKLAIENYDKKAIDRLEELFHITNKAFVKRDIQNYVKNDVRFHRHLCSMSKNYIITVMWDTFAKPVTESIRFNIESVYSQKPSIEPYHLMLVKSIRAKDLDGALKNLHLALTDIL